MRVALSFVAIAVVVVGIAYLFAGWQWQRGLEGAEAAELRGLLAMWKDSGRPTGADLEAFMRGRRPDLVPTNGMIEFNGTNLVLRFAAAKPRTGKAGMMVITEEGHVIWCGTGERPVLMR